MRERFDRGPSLAEQRNELMLTVSQVARQLGVSGRFIRLVESGPVVLTGEEAFDANRYDVLLKQLGKQTPGERERTLRRPLLGLPVLPFFPVVSGLCVLAVVSTMLRAPPGRPSLPGLALTDLSWSAGVPFAGEARHTTGEIRVRITARRPTTIELHMGGTRIHRGALAHQESVAFDLSGEVHVTCDRPGDVVVTRNGWPIASPLEQQRRAFVVEGP